MKKTIFIIIILICSINLYSQDKDSIVYVFSDKIEQKLYKQIEKIDSTCDLKFEFYLQFVDKDKFRLSFTYSKKASNNYWAKNTNRFILIKDCKYPLIFDYDSIFSTSKPKEIGSFGKREGTIMKSIFIYDGYNITFDKNGESLEEDWGIYKKDIK